MLSLATAYPYGAETGIQRIMARSAAKHRWVRTVTTDSTHPPPGLFNRAAEEIARSLASKKVSPKGPASGMRMLNYYINRGGKNLSARRKAVLERAKHLLSERIAEAKKMDTKKIGTKK